MKFPYGLCDFYRIITNDYFYVDRTDRISMFEDVGEHLLFLRPRRFGKSLLLSMLENYYDVAKTEEFEKLFGHLEIGKNPTALHNQYLVLKWDFSAVNSQGDPEEIQQNLYRYLNGRIDKFVADYQDFLPREIHIDPVDAMASFQSLLTAVQQSPYKLYLLIDEYDNFANEVMMSRREMSADRYKALVHGEGCLKAVFKVVKSATAGEGLDRAFITGVSPVVMSDITSGHNIAKNVYLRPEFKDLCGFWETEIQNTLQLIGEECKLPEKKVDEALDIMRTFYNGYAFTYNQDALLYNPTLSLYFMEHLQTYCEYPREMLDSNLATDRQKLDYIAQLPGGEQVIADALNEQQPLGIDRLADRFGVEEILRVSHDRTRMASLLYYLGVLTMGGITASGKLILKIPNVVVRRLYIDQIQELVLPDGEKNTAAQVAEIFYTTGNIQPLCEFIEQCYFKAFDNRDYRWANELTVKTAFLTLLFNDTFYIVDSETALERGYADMTMIIRPDMRQYQLLDILLEFKYVGLAKHGLIGEQVRQMGFEELKALTPVQEQLTEANAVLKDYRAALQSRYGDVLRLHAYSVVAIGFDRLVWQEIDD